MNTMQMLSQFNNFKNNFKGDPKAEVEKLIASGRITQSQLDQLQAAAREFQKLLSK